MAISDQLDAVELGRIGAECPVEACWFGEPGYNVLASLQEGECFAVNGVGDLIQDPTCTIPKGYCCEVSTTAPPTLSPSTSPTQSPTLSPSTSPTQSPSTSPTQSPSRSPLPEVLECSERSFGFIRPLP